MNEDSQSFGDWSLRRLMTEVVGSGHKSAEDMTREQAREAFGRILAEDPDPTTLGAFWLANRWKRNTPEELGAYIDVMAEESVNFAAPDCDPVDCGANYDGKHTSALLGVGAGCVAAAAGTPCVVHSGDRVPTQKATAYKHVLSELGVRTEIDPEESAAMTDAVGFGFYYQPEMNPAVHALFDRRDQMGVRTFVNTIETLCNPADASVHLGSFYHLPYAKRIIDTFEASERYDIRRVLMFQGMEGYDDIRPGSTKVAVSTDGDLSDFEIETGEYGMEITREDLAVSDVARDSARITEEVLNGEREMGEDGFADAIALNAALRIYAREDAESIDEGLTMARNAISDESAAGILQELKAF